MKTINSFRSKLFALTLALMASVASFAYEFEYVNDFHINGFAYKVLPSNTLFPYGSAALIEIADCNKDVVIPEFVSYENTEYRIITFGMGSVVFTNDASSVVESITIPKTTSVINKNALAGCPNLKTVVVDSGNPYYDSRENCNAIITTSQNPYFTPNTLIAGCKTTIIPNSVAEIGDNAFYNSALESITIPTGTTKIGRSAFNNSILLSSITLSATLIEISDWAFDDCNNLKEVICYAPQPPTISKYTFSDISPIVYVPKNTVTIYQNAPYWMTFDIQSIQPSYKSQWCDKWNVLELKYRYSSYTTKEDFETWRYYLAQDTIINNYTYTAVTRQTTKVPEGVYPFTIPEPEYVAAVRFTDDRKVYIYYDNTEYLLYDFNVQPGDELTVFAGINHYHSHHTNTIRVDEVFGTEMSLSVFPDFYGDVRPTCFGVTKWVEGVGDLCGFITGADCGLSEYQTALLCAYKDGNTEYTTEYEEYTEYGCEYNSGENKEYILTLPGLQRTVCNEYCGETEEDNSANFTYKQTFDSIFFENDKPYILCNGYLLREEDNKIFLYSQSLNKDIVLYDFTLEVGDLLPTYIKDFDGTMYSDDTLVVTGISSVTLLDGKKYKKWTFNNGMEYVEAIGMYGGRRNGNFFGLIQEVVVPCHIGTHLVCVSKNNKLLYQMDDAEMERLGAECLCEAENPEDLFPTLWGLQRTSCDEWYDGCGENKSYLFAPKEVKEINGKLYLKCGGVFLREEDSKVLIYSFPYEKDFVLYDYTLEVGGTLQNLGIDIYSFPELEYAAVVDYMAYEDYDVETDEFIIKKEPLGSKRVQEVSTITLLDGKEYKRWLFGNDWENGNYYIEGIGNVGGSFGGDYIDIANPYGTPIPTCYLGERLVCASRNNKLLYQMDDTEMERLGAECLCEIEPKWSETWCNQWNILSHGYLGPQDPLAGARTSIFWLSNNTVNRDGQEYIPLMCSSSKPDVESTNLIGELRFTEDKQVYFYYDNTEYLLYDFDVQVGDTLDIFGGIELYSYSFVEQKTYPHVITKIDTLDDGRLQITSDAIVIFEDGEVGTFEEKQQQIWIEGLGSINGIVHTGINPGIAGNPAIVMLCAYRDDECVYKTDSNDPYWIDYTQLGCVYNEGDFIEGAFPILSGLQRTVYDEFCGEAEIGAAYTGKQTFDKIFFENDKPYILCNDYLLHEEDNKILIYSQLLNKDLVLYDFTLEVGDSLPALYIDYHARNARHAMDWMPYNPDVVDYNKDFDGTIYPADTFVVTDVSNVTLLDGKEYKKWTFNNGMEYVEAIGMYSGRRNGNFFGLIQEVVVPCHIGTHLVCVSKNNKLLYQMDDAEMERLGAECLCEYNSGPKKDNAKNGKIGGRPTPTQWNMLEVETKEMDGTPTILRAETFSYTLENDSIVTNGKTFYQLARQSTKDTAITKSFVGALHFGEDKDNRVYFLRDGHEYVLYDFTAEPGDTIEIFAGINNYPQETTYTHVVVDKDTTEDGACRMFLEVVFPDETTTATNAEKVWLAGLGSIDGIVHNAAQRTSDAHAAPSRSASSETQTSVMLCAWREDSCLYTTNHPEYDTFGCVYNQDPTEVENLTSPSSYQKIIHEGTLLILHEGKVYNVIGIQIK